MKRTDLLRHLHDHGCRLVREGARLSIYSNQESDRFSSIPRHREIKNYLSRNICRDLGIPTPEKK